MELAGEREPEPLYENGTAPRVFVADVERLDRLADGVYCFVCSCPTNIGGNRGREVVLYLECTPMAIAKGIILSFTCVKELSRLLSRMKFLTFH